MSRRQRTEGEAHCKVAEVIDDGQNAFCGDGDVAQRHQKEIPDCADYVQRDHGQA